MKKTIILFIFFLFILSAITLSIKGNGNPIVNQTATDRNTKVGGPFESTNSSSRYTIIESLVENKTVTFSMKQAEFAAPDIAEYKGKIFSLFTPGVSFVGVPFYMVGKIFGLPQIFTYYSVSLFAVLNAFLIYFLARKLGSGLYSSLIAGFIFLFASNAFAYALSFTQHHMSTALILLAIINAIGRRTLVNNIFLGIIVGTALLMDIPNIFFLLPILIYIFIKQFILKNDENKLQISFDFNIAGFLLGILPFLLIFASYNHAVTGSYTKLGQMIGRVDYKQLVHPTKEFLKEQEQKATDESSLPFQSRFLLNGFYILLLSNERSWLFYSPVILLGIAGFVILYKRKESQNAITLSSSVIVINILTYAMFADPWGGWSYGARYLIPSAAILSIGIAPVIDRFKKNYFFIPLFLALSSFSIYINTLGAQTTSSIPPRIEAISLDKPIPYTYEYNLKLLDTQNLSSSLFYNLYFSKNMSSKDYINVFSGTLILMIVLLYILSYREKISKKGQ